MTEILNQTQERFANKRNILIRDDLEYTAGRLFTYSTIGLTAIIGIASVAYLIVVQLKK